MRRVLVTSRISWNRSCLVNSCRRSTVAWRTCACLYDATVHSVTCLCWRRYLTLIVMICRNRFGNSRHINRLLHLRVSLVLHHLAIYSGSIEALTNLHTSSTLTELILLLNLCVIQIARGLIAGTRRRLHWKSKTVGKRLQKFTYCTIPKRINDFRSISRLYGFTELPIITKVGIFQVQSIGRFRSRSINTQIDGNIVALTSIGHHQNSTAENLSFHSKQRSFQETSDLVPVSQRLIWCYRAKNSECSIRV